MIINSFTAGPWQTNSYLLRDNPDSLDVVLIDPGVKSAHIVRQVLADRGWRLAGVLGTHGHLDHIGDAAEMANEAGVPLWLHGADFFMLRTPSAGFGLEWMSEILSLIGEDRLPEPKQLRDLSEIADFEVAGIHFTVTHAPGHTPGSVLFAVDTDEGPVKFVGDVLFFDGIGRTDLPGGDSETMIDTLNRVILNLPDDSQIIPGHGNTTIMGRERAHNPFLQPAFLKEA